MFGRDSGGTDDEQARRATDHEHGRRRHRRHGIDQGVQADGFHHQSDPDPEGRAIAGLCGISSRRRSPGAARRARPRGAVTDRLAVNFGAELTRIVPGRVSTEVDADLSFDTAATIAKAEALIADYESRGIGRERILIKIAATWEGAQAAAVLQPRASTAT